MKFYLDTTPETLNNLILRNNIYDSTTFDSSSQLFNDVKEISGKLDLQNSRFQLNIESNDMCIFNIFQSITKLDFSNIQFEISSNDIDIYSNLARLLECKTSSNQNQLHDLYLRFLKLQRLPSWLTNEQFPELRHLDLSNNFFYSIDIQAYQNLMHISLAYNPIEFDQIRWRNETIYGSIDLRSTVRYSTFNLTDHLITLFKLTRNVDYSENQGENRVNITQIPIGVDSSESKTFDLNISRTNIMSFNIEADDILRLDLSSNYLTQLNLSKQNQLKYLDCSNQSLQTLTLSPGSSQLKILRCSNNNLTTIENFHSIKKEYFEIIDLSYNSIISLEDFFANFEGENLRQINLRSNFIRLVRENMFPDKLINLIEIDLSYNRIWKIEKYAFQAPNLQILDLTGNLLTLIEPYAIFTSSLRYFSIVNTSQTLTDRCLQTDSTDYLLSMYLEWYIQNGTLMKPNSIEFNKCLNRYVPKSKTDRFTKKTKQVFGGYAISIIGSACLILILLTGLYYYRKNTLPLLGMFQRYKMIDQLNLTENEEQMSRHPPEDEETVIDVFELSDNTKKNAPTNV